LRKDAVDVVAFSDFVLDRRKRQLRRGTEDLPLGARAMDLLDTLAL
jgi:DNA-binding winged helix-turn-helix (wHTH) protein